MTFEAHIGRPLRLVPGPAVAPGTEAGRSNNNLDAARWRERWWLAWRAAPTHFASDQARVNVVSAPAVEGPWRHETTVAVGADVREPRFLELGTSLFLYVMELGTNPRAFEPRRIHALVHDGSGWSAPEVIHEGDVVPWRPRVLGGRAIFSVYRGAATLYTSHLQTPTVELWTSEDGLEWRPLHDDPVIHVGGTETDIVEAPGGGLVGVTRIEGPDAHGSAVLTGSLERAGQWTVRPDRRKFDSPLLLRRGEDVLLVARRTLAFGGRYDLGLDRLPPLLRTRLYQVAYSFTRKRSALWRLDPSDLGIQHVTDLPSRGDTSFGAAVDLDGKAMQVFDYTSPPERTDLPWLAGQIGPTVIHTFRVEIAT